MKRVVAWLVAAVGVLSRSDQDAAATQAGFYRVAKIDNVWCFIRPDGSPFFSSGVNVVDPGPARGDYDTQRPAYAATPRVGRPVNGEPPIVRVDFGDGHKLLVSNSEFACRLQHKIRYTAVVKLPAEKLGYRQLNRGDCLTINAALIDRQLGTMMKWERKLDCDGPRARLGSKTKSHRIDRRLETQFHSASIGPKQQVDTLQERH